MAGPNIQYGFSGSAAPAGLTGIYVPRANANFEFNWIEPLGEGGYGSWKNNKTNYIRFLAGAELSPFYGTIRFGLGFAVLPPPFAILELRFVYSNENLLFSDVELPMKPNENPSITDRWNAKYLFDNLYDNSSFSQIHSYDAQLGGKYISHKFDFSFLFHFMLIDIFSDYDKKSFDYMRGMPLYSRDYIVAEELFATYRFGKHFAWDANFTLMISGRQFTFYAPFEAYDKEPLYYSLVSTGPVWRFNDGRSYISVTPGFLWRGNEKTFKDPIAERIILSVQYKHFWDFRFGKE